jgi:hypothetical protein
LHSIGRRYVGPLRIELATRGPDGATTFYDSTASVDLPTGDLVQRTYPVPIRSQDLGWRTVEARVTVDDSTGAPLVQTQIDSFHVDANRQAALNVAVKPNPVRDPADAVLALDLTLPGELLVDVYDLEGQRIASSVRGVQPLVTTSKIELPLVQTSGAGSFPGDLASGAYLVRVIWRGSNGESSSGTATLVVRR